MCGYCFENGFLIPYLEAECFGKDFELTPLGTTQYIQEASHLFKMVHNIQFFNIFKHTLPIMFCRLYASFLADGFDGRMYPLIRSLFGMKATTAFVNHKQKQYDGLIWQELGNEALYATEDGWRAFIADRKRLTDASRLLLQEYHDWWLQGKGKQFSDQDQRFKDTGIYDPLLDTTPEDWQTFEARFPIIFLAFSLLTRFDSDSPLVQQIALNGPHGMPGFEANDLWLQRLAFADCTRRRGVGFLIDNLARVRYEVIYYTLLKVKMNRHDLEKVQAALPGGKNPYGTNYEPEDLQALVERLLSETT